MIRIDPKLAWQIAQLAKECRAQRLGGLWGVFPAPQGQRFEINFVYDDADQRHLARGTDVNIREIFSRCIDDVRRDRENLAVEKLQALAAVYRVSRGRHVWQTVVIERSAVVYGWSSPNGIDAAVANALKGMNALGFLSMALPELLSDLIHEPGKGQTA
ncbi:hypothetical protein [Glycomyces tenuis]|uniref:hypothetical protein n=1 Tax=Glycomyces tenuis TaxID=58116 RepID=UPI00041C016E|nr:hypothetical protein [Glycomyces tenuis]